MKFFKLKKFLAVPLFLCLLFMLFASPIQGKELTKQDCLDAFKRCGVDAVIALVTGGFVVGLAYMSGCLVGYDFCVRYLIIN